MITSLSFADVLMIPKYSTVNSRKDVDISTTVAGNKLLLPIISSNMDTVTSSTMANAMANAGGAGCLHRFQSIESNVEEYYLSHPSTWCSVGVGKDEYERARALIHAGAKTIVLDVAHGASQIVVDQVKQLDGLCRNNDVALVVGNFATAESIKSFNHHLGYKVDGYKIGIGGGSVCQTRIVTGCGLPTFASLLEVRSLGLDIIADGGISNSGDFAKCLAVGAKAVFLGGMLAGTDEASGEFVTEKKFNGEWSYDKFLGHTPEYSYRKLKKYRGSASAESYETQGKTSEHRTAEGISTYVPYVGSVAGVLQTLSSGLRSSMAYLGASNLEEFREQAEFSIVTGNGHIESLPKDRR